MILNRKVIFWVLLIGSGALAMVVSGERTRLSSISSPLELTGPGLHEPAVGSRAPDFMLTDVTGHDFKLSAQVGKPVTLVFFCGCVRCQYAARRISDLQRQNKFPVIISVIALPPGAAQIFVRQSGLKSLVLSDPSEMVESQYASAFCPRLWGISPAGYISYRSEIALQGNDLDKALRALEVSTKSGCGVSDALKPSL